MHSNSCFHIVKCAFLMMKISACNIYWDKNYTVFGIKVGKHSGF